MLPIKLFQHRTANHLATCVKLLTGALVRKTLFCRNKRFRINFSVRLLLFDQCAAIMLRNNFPMSA